MISELEIQKLTTKYQSLELNVRREYYQHLFLAYFYQQKKSDLVFFKGGTALRIIYQSPRFSEDLDFSANIDDVTVIEKMMINTLVEIERIGIEVELKESKKTSGGYLAILNFRNNNQTVVIQIEISMRQTKSEGEVEMVVNDFVLPYTLIGLKKDQLVGEKVEALLSRQKPRDFYDIYYILRRGLMPLNIKDKLEQVKKVLVSSKINFEIELKQFLPRSHWMVIGDFENMLQKELDRN